MCTIVLLLRPGHHWPVVIAANRDEMADRSSQPPARHWPDRADVVAGLDELGQGTWLGMNDHGVVAAILNRTGSLGPQAGKRSRGELPLEALDHADAASAVKALCGLNAAAYRPFNMVVVDNTRAYWLRSDGLGDINAFPIATGVHMLTASELDDTESHRIQHNLDAFTHAAAPDPDTGDWRAWEHLLIHGKGMSFHLPNNYGTVSSSLIALPSVECFGKSPVWLYTHTPPGQAPYSPVLSIQTKPVMVL